MYSQEKLPVKQIKAVVLDSLQANKVIKVIEEGKLAITQKTLLQANLVSRNVYIGKLEQNKKTLEQMVSQYESLEKDKDLKISNAEQIIKRQDHKITFWTAVAIVFATATGIVAITH